MPEAFKATAYEELVAAIVKAVPEIIEWKIGCRVRGMHGEILILVGQRELRKPPESPLDFHYPRAKGRHTHVDVFQREDGSRYEYTFSDEKRIIGRDITLEDVLMFLQGKCLALVFVDGVGEGIVGIQNTVTNEETVWILGKPISEQSDATKLFLHSLLV